MFSPLLIKISFATVSSVGVAIGGYFLYKNTSSKKVTEVVSSSPSSVGSSVNTTPSGTGASVPGIGG